MVMEFCEITLQQWLTDNSSITVDVLENMLTFCWNIARGLEHLHALKFLMTDTNADLVFTEMPFNASTPCTIVYFIFVSNVFLFANKIGQ